jgi:uncharacterized protein YbaP (TraB family)
MANSIRIGLFILLIAVALPASAAAGAGCPPVIKKPTPEMMQAAMRNARDHGFLWRISKDGRTSFLYGTIHVAKLDWIFPGPSVSQALRTTDTLALELDSQDADIKDRVAKGLKALHSTALPEPLEKRMRQQAAAVCVPYNSIAWLTPELQVTILSVMDARRDELDAAYAIDTILAGLGHSTKKSMVSLETPELQLNLSQMRTPQETVAYVQVSLDELEDGRSRALLKRFSQAWANADYTEMTHYDEWCECLNTEIERDVMKRLNDERNPHLADRIDALHGSGKQVFAAVGSLHMFGPIGLPALMAKRGYLVERVDLK